MRYSVQFETDTYLRIRLFCGRISEAEEEVLTYAISQMKPVQHVRVYPATGGISITYEKDRDLILQKLSALQYQNVELFADQLEKRIGVEEVERRKLSPALKRKMRRRMLLETLADIALPMPVQVGYHVYQLVTLKGM
ncbi:MAG: hypothetical protein IJ239_00385 [Eubacterium sp.]|nr:hypothetical protein [Eubacterium sp.]